jgi:hypothetical protein
MADETDVIAFLQSLFTDSETVKALTDDPGAVFADRGVADATAQQLNQGLATLATSPGALPPALQGRLEAAISSSPGGLFSDVGYRGSAPAVFASVSPVVAGYAQTAAALTAVTYPPSITQQVTNVTNVDESTHITDESIHQRLVNIGGELNNTIASGAGAVAAGPDARVTAATGSGTAIGEGADVDRTIFAGNAPITHGTLIAGDNSGQISGQDEIHGSNNVTDAGLTGSSVGSIGTTNDGASQGAIKADGGSPVNVDSPGAAAASGGSQAATGGGAPGAEGGSIERGGDNLQVGGTNVNATDATGVQATGAGDPTQLAQNQQGFGTGVGDVGQPSVQLQSGELDTGGGDGPIYADASAPQDPGLGATDSGISPEPMDQGYSDQSAGSEFTDP